MKKALVAIMIAAITASVAVPQAEAKRLGGGGSIGRQSGTVTRQATPPAAPYQQQAARPAPAPTAPPVAPKPASPWKGILGGALLGLGLGALFSHLGIGGAMGGLLGSLLTIALVVMAVTFLFRLFRRQSANAGGNGMPGGMQPAWAGAGNATPEIGSRLEPAQLQPAASAPGAAAAAAPWGVPADFDTAGFLRHAKTAFIRLQAAWDKADINDIREFTTPEMFGELRLQLQERGAAANHTDVVSVDAELLGIETVGNDYVASVKFSGAIREEEHAAPAPFAEVWNLVKPVSGGGWLLAGIQQLN